MITLQGRIAKIQRTYPSTNDQEAPQPKGNPMTTGHPTYTATADATKALAYDATKGQRNLAAATRYTNDGGAIRATLRPDIKAGDILNQHIDWTYTVDTDRPTIEATFGTGHQDHTVLVRRLADAVAPNGFRYQPGHGAWDGDVEHCATITLQGDIYDTARLFTILAQALPNEKMVHVRYWDRKGTGTLYFDLDTIREV